MAGKMMHRFRHRRTLVRLALDPGIGMTSTSHSSLDLLAARFIIQTLSLDLVPEVLVPTLNRIERDDHTAVYAVQLESSVGPAAFLVYGYEASLPGQRGATSQQRYATDVRTLEVAQSRNVPGPRLIASGELGGNLFVLATDPQTFAALAGVEATTNSASDSERNRDPAEVRRDAAGELITLLRNADQQAGRWLRAIYRQDTAGGHGSTPATPLVFDDVETELALYLLGPDGIRNVLTLTSRILESAQAANAASSNGRESVGPVPTPTPIDTARNSRTRNPERK